MIVKLAPIVGCIGLGAVLVMIGVLLVLHIYFPEDRPW